MERITNNVETVNFEAKPRRALMQDATYLTSTSPWTKAEELPVSVKAVESWGWMTPVWKALR